MTEVENRKIAHGRFSLYREHKFRFSAGKRRAPKRPKGGTCHTCVGTGEISGARRVDLIIAGWTGEWARRDAGGHGALIKAITDQSWAKMGNKASLGP